MIMDIISLVLSCIAAVASIAALVIVKRLEKAGDDE
nr:MAG TPA: hypothetical protein [Caudoviricetes sp.]